jgi:pimeloyl-ACP methyl ester carboxylesterase
MKTKFKKLGKKIIKVFVIILGVIVLLNIIGFAANKIFFAKELEAIIPYGQMVEVDGKEMHVYSMGSAEETIVLLPGFGIALPSADFGPLMRELSQDYTVVTIEYFGTGFSDQIDTPRTNENFTEEVRAALAKAGFAPPYILMPHSASGIYSEYYAAKYPEEVSAIIMLDTTSTAKNEAANMPKFVYGISMVQQECGLTRVSYSLVPPAQKVENGYTEKEINDYKLFAYHVLNDTIIDQSYRILENIQEVNQIPFPQDIPVLKLITSQSLEKVGEAYQTDHLNRLGDTAESMVIDSTHFIYQTNVTDICEATRAFLENRP